MHYPKQEVHRVFRRNRSVLLRGTPVLVSAEERVLGAELKTGITM